MPTPIEANYPVAFRATEAELLGAHLKQHSSVVLIGMKRVGISNFLRFFLNQPHVPQTYIRNGPHLFVPIDLNDLIERSPSPFWMLTLKRLTDTIQSSDLSETVKAKAQHLFAESIQLQDSFFTLENVRKLCQLVVEEQRSLTLFMIRFDRLQEAMTSEFFANLQGLKDAVGSAFGYVFTSHRPLPDIVPHVITKASLSVFARDLYLKPAVKDDLRMILESLLKRYELRLAPKLAESLLDLAGGHVQYLQLAIIKLKNNPAPLPASRNELEKMLQTDEEISLLSEEIFESLRGDEQKALIEFVQSPSAKKTTSLPAYLQETGLVHGPKDQIFNPLFAHYVVTQKTVPSLGSYDLTKKENALFELLLQHEGSLVERDDIIEIVWPEQAELGVSDWALDRLVARLRLKLKEQHSSYMVVTVVSRGYKLVKNEPTY